MRIVPDRWVDGGLILLAPSQARLPQGLQHVQYNPGQHRLLLSQVQRLRGSIYLTDGALHRSFLTPDGRHIQPLDAASWHLIGVTRDGTVRSCARYTEHRNTVVFEKLGVSTSAIARSHEWGQSTRKAVEQDLRRARDLGLSFVELGGWAIAPELRRTSEVLRIALGTYALAQMLGGALGIGTVTLRHHSASILKRLGGTPLSFNGFTLPMYEDPKYGCLMELLRFSSEDAGSRFDSRVEEIAGYLEQAPVFVAGSADESPYIPAASESYQESGLLCA